MDLCHRDGSLKREVAANPSKYIHDVSWRWSGVRGLEGFKRGGRGCAVMQQEGKAETAKVGSKGPSCQREMAT